MQNPAKLSAERVKVRNNSALKYSVSVSALNGAISSICLAMAVVAVLHASLADARPEAGLVATSVPLPFAPAITVRTR